MANYRKLSIVSSIGLAAIVIALYSLPLVDWYATQNQPVSTVFDSARGDDPQPISHNIPLTKGDPPVQPTIVAQPNSDKSQGLSTASKNITLSGWVGTEFGNSLAGETVALYSTSQKAHHSTITDNSGEFKFNDLKPSWDYELAVSPQGMFKRYSQSSIKLRSEQEVHNIILESIPLGILTGKIVDPYDRPVTDIELQVTTVEKSYKTTNVITDANGAFSVVEFPQGKFQMAIRGAQSIKAIGLKFDPDTGLPIILTIDHGPYNLSGGIYDESGQTFDGADVFLNWVLLENSVIIRSTRKTSANARGNFRFSGLGPGDHELVVTAWRGNSFKQTLRRTVNVGVDSGELILVFNTLSN